VWGACLRPGSRESRWQGAFAERGQQPLKSRVPDFRQRSVKAP
jgi:hypothetical protein